MSEAYADQRGHEVAWMTAAERGELDTRQARQAIPVHHEATPVLRESWSVVNPRGREIHYGSRDEAATAARTGIW